MSEAQPSEFALAWWQYKREPDHPCPEDEHRWVKVPEEPDWQECYDCGYQREWIHHQKDAFTADERYVNIDGGWGNGKSTTGILRLGNHCIRNPGTKVGFFRQDSVDLGRSTIPDWMELFGDYGDVHGKTNIFTFDGFQSQVVFHHLSELTKLKNHNFSAWVIEQAEETTEDAFWYLVGRLRRTDADNQWGMVLSNPNGHDWVWKLFCQKEIEPPNEAALERLEEHGIDKPGPEDFKYIHAESFANARHLDDETLKGYATLPEELYRRFVEGDRDSFAGQIYSNLRSGLHKLKPFEIPRGWPKWMTLDWGETNPTAVLWITMDYDGNYYVYREHYLKQGDEGKEWLPKDHVDAIEAVEQDRQDAVCPYEENIQRRFIDPACSAQTKQKNNKKYSIMELFEEQGMYFEGWPQSNSPQETQAQIMRVKEMFEPREDREVPRGNRAGESPAPKLYIFDTCRATWEEHTQWKWKELSSRMIGEKNAPEKPVDRDDHTCDALRGFIVEVITAPVEPDPQAPHGSFKGVFRELIQESDDDDGGYFTQPAMPK